MVVGSNHFESRYISLLKYIPGVGPWSDSKNSYKRILEKYDLESISETYKFLKKNYPKYLYFSHMHQTIYQLIKLQDIKEVYLCKEKIKEDPKDELVKKAIELINFLSKEFEISINSFGITGSILLGIHNLAFSDIDIVVYGKWGYKILQVISNYKDKNFSILENKRGGYFKDTYFSLSFAEDKSSIYDPNLRYEKKGQIKAKCRIISSERSIYLPQEYEIEILKIIEGPNVSNIKKIVSYLPKYFYASKDQNVYVEGILEKATTKNDSYHRILLGSMENKNKDKIYAV